MIFFDFIESLIRGLSGPVGRFLRYRYYKIRLKRCGKGVVIDCGVYIVNPSCIELGNNVWIDKNVVLLAGEIDLKDRVSRIVENPHYLGKAGEIKIGDYSHVGIDTIIQGHGGVSLGSYFTSSAGCKIFSHSNDPKKCISGTLLNSRYTIHPVSMGENVWIGLHCIVLGHHIGNNTFVGPNTIIYNDIPEGITFMGEDIPTRQRFLNNE